MKNRLYLKNNILLCGKSDGEAFKRTFTVVKKISEGASSVCYEAYHGDSGRGVLKEYYPQGDYTWERDKNGQLINSSDLSNAAELFREEEKEYIKPYEMLMEAKQKGKNPELSSFIPSFEIYHGCDKDGNTVGTTYIWTPEPKLETFDSICDDIHKHPNSNPEHKLVTVLTAVESLTRCIGALHGADMIHRDIKPSNFGFINRGNETLTQTISLFDINSICSVDGAAASSVSTVGTEGYREPEAETEAASKQTDIYSIGAVLFHAIVVSDEAKAGGYLYKSEYYGSLREMIDNSMLIRASEANSHPRLRNTLFTILHNCLCERAVRYASAEDLLADLKTALFYALPSDIAKLAQSGQKWILADAEKSLDVNKEKNSTLAIQYHLYEHPLYKCLSDKDKSINVLVIGFGNYGQKFLDACLQAGQLRNRKLNVTVISDDETDKKLYTDERPELENFFNVDGSLKDRDDEYGNITFKTRKLERENQSISKTIDDIMCYDLEGDKDDDDDGEADSEHYPHYVFIALGDDDLNYTAAAACLEAAKVFEISCSVNYVSENEQLIRESSDILCPIYVNRDIKKSALYPEIERMAFNTHLIWEKNLNVDFRSIKADFRKKYNHDSSVSSVLALKYKLYSMGIDLDKCSFDEAARRYREALPSGNIKNELIWIEHRRWVTEKLCLGWRRIINPDECVGGLTKDEKNKRHICIVRSRPDQKLAEEFSVNGDYSKWDTATNKELNHLDALDRMSVKLHRAYKNRADALKEQNWLYDDSMPGVRTLIDGNKKAVAAFREWFTCIKDIWNGDVRKVRLYKGLKSAFLKATDTLSPEYRKSVREQVRAFETEFYPILASTEYRDWKQDDVAFIDNIPFVLTYTEDAYMVIPFVTGDNSGIFGNLTAPTFVNPARIIYLYLVEHRQDIAKLYESVPYVIEYMSKKHFKAAVEFVLAYNGKVTVDDKAAEELKNLGKGRIRQVKLINCADNESVAAEVESYLKKRRAGKRFFAVEKNSAGISYLLQGAGKYNAFANYTFDQDNLNFYDLNGCDMLGCIKKSPYLAVTDIAAFRLSSAEISSQPVFFDDYEEFWKKYCDNPGGWKKLCKVLEKYSDENDKILSLDLYQKNILPSAKKYRYIIPSFCSTGAEKIVRFLKEKKIVEPDSEVKGYTTDSCEAVIYDRRDKQGEYDKLFSKVYALMIPDAVTPYINPDDKTVCVKFDDLVVKDAEIKSDYDDLMNFFSKKGYIIDLSTDANGKKSFTYATGRIKELMTTGGKVLEIYTYHKVKELGEFDDMAYSFVINWEDKDVKNELDCILTKGFRTLFVECKARLDIDQEYYEKLNTLCGRFGINATAVLVADIKRKTSYNQENNEIQIDRGNMLKIVTVSDPDEIDDIGNTLLKVINGTYVS